MKALDAANYLVYLTGDSFDDMSNMKINKLLYFGQGYFLKEYGIPLFEDTIEAWDHGPVIPSVYFEYKGFDDKSIKEYDETCLKSITEEEKDILFKVARKYGRYSAGYLRELTHAPGSPWDDVYTYGVKHITIPVKTIEEYFRRQDDLILSEREFTDDDFIGYRDEAGILVLPREWDDEEI